MYVNKEVKSAGRVLDLIAYLANCREPVGLARVSRDMSLPGSSLHALLHTLVARGHVHQGTDGRFVLVEESRHGFPFRRNENALVHAAMPVMMRLRDHSDETVILSILTAGGEIRRLSKVVSRNPVRYDVHIDAAITPHCTASGRVLLAYAPGKVVNAYFARVTMLGYTPRTETRPAVLRDLLHQVRRQGHAVNDGEFVTGSTGIAIPLRGASGRVVAALNLGMPSTRYLGRERVLLAMLQEAGRKIQTALVTAATVQAASMKQGNSGDDR